MGWKEHDQNDDADELLGPWKLGRDLLCTATYTGSEILATVVKVLGHFKCLCNKHTCRRIILNRRNART